MEKLYTNEMIVDFLKEVRARSFEPYGKLADGVDARYALALGLIGGVVTEALDSVREDRPFRDFRDN